MTDTETTRAPVDTGPDDGAESPESARARRSKRSNTIFASSFLVFLVYPAVTLWQRGGATGIGGLVLILLFCAWYVAGYLVGEGSEQRWVEPVRRVGVAGWLVGLTLMSFGLVALAGPASIMTLIYVAAGGGAALPARPGLAVVLGCGLATVGLGMALRVDLVFAVGSAVWVVAIGLMVWGSMISDRHRCAVLAEREEKAALAVELERTRMARDLHDILGHSLTVVAVKAELARRLVDADPARAKDEIADVERLARDALSDVRSTVATYRQMSLPAELVRAARALEAAGIAADVPGAADDVPTPLRDLFAWVVREGVTNVVRHSGASRCTIVLSADAVEIRDDGAVREPVLPGNGLVGLVERARQVGASLTYGPARPHGFVVRAAVIRHDAEAGR